MKNIPPVLPLKMIRFICGLFAPTILFCASAADIEWNGRAPVEINAVVQKCQSGDTLWLPNGTFSINEPIRMKSGIKLIGKGQGKTVIICAGIKPDSMIRINNCENIEISHLTLDAKNDGKVREGISGHNSRRLFLHHVTIRNLAKGDSSFVHGILFSGNNPTMQQGVTDSVISDCYFDTIGQGAEYGGGIRMAWGSNRNRVERNVIRKTGRGGIFGDHSSELVIQHNHVSGSGGEGLGIELWGGCPKSLIEDNRVDHWISVDQGNQTAVRRNVVGADDGSLKGYGIEIIASDIVVTDNTVKGGASIGLSVSNVPRKNNVYWGYNTISDCVQWGAQFQGETGGIAHHYFYQCKFENTIVGDPRARYPKDSGHGFRFNGSCREMVFENCTFANNGGYAIQFVGKNVDAVTFLRCVMDKNRKGTVVGLSSDQTVDFNENTVDGIAGQFPRARTFSTPLPTADFQMPETIRAGEPAQFTCQSKPGKGQIVERLWDFNHGIAETTANPHHTFDQPGKYRITLIVWDTKGRGSRVEKNVKVLAANTQLR